MRRQRRPTKLSSVSALCSAGYDLRALGNCENTNSRSNSMYTPVAQQVEHLTFNLVVDGSNPFRRTKGDLQPYKCETLKSEVRFRSTPYGSDKTTKRLMVRYDSVG